VISGTGIAAVGQFLARVLQSLGIFKEEIVV